MKYYEEVDDVGAVEGGHVEHKDDLGPLDECDSQCVGQRPDQAPQRSEGRDENGKYLTASYEHIIYFCFNLEEETFWIFTYCLIYQKQ